VSASLRLYLLLVGARVRSQMQYRTSFALALLASMVYIAIEFGSVLVIFGRVPSIAGWSLCEVALLYGLSETSFATAEFIGSALDDFHLRIRRGTFDRVLTRPHGAFLQVLADELALRRLGRVTQAVLVLALALRCAAIDWTPDRVAVLMISLASGVVVFFSIFVLAAAFCFWTVEGKEATHVFSYGGVTLSDYPIDVYSDWLRRFVTFVLPLAFVSYAGAA
jgi:ABC-2 type transport system permease protein